MNIYEIKLGYNLISLGEETTLDTPQSVVSYMTGAFDEDPMVEWFFIIALDRRNHPIGRSMITKGTVSASLVHPREIFRPVILAGASSFIAVHNHPSGNVEPSQADIRATRQIREAAKIMDIDFLDHLIIGSPFQDKNTGYFSFNEGGLL
jgi:DNA repair protein RadC